MGFIKEPINLDFVVDPRPLTEKEKLAISEFIRADKEKREQKNLRKRHNLKKSF